jgi:Flp pilus assembly CpaE family ATPase
MILPNPVRVLLVEDNRIEARQTQQWLANAREMTFEVETVDRLATALERLSRGGIDIVLLDLNLPDSRGLETFDTLYEQVVEVPVVVLTGEHDEEIGIVAVEKGAEDYLVKQQVDPLRLPRVLQFAVARRGVHLEQLKKSLGGASARYLGFVGAKGGVGTTTVALNVAVALAKRSKSVILAEIRPSPGSLARSLRQEPSSGLRTLLELPPERLGDRQIEDVLCHGPARIQILFGPQPGESYDPIDPEQVQAVVKGLGRLADFVVLDLPSQLSPATRAVVHDCDFVGLITEREAVSVHCGRVIVDQLKSWGVSGSLLGVIVNSRINIPVPMELASIRSRLGCDIIRVVPPAGPSCMVAQEDGVALVTFDPENTTSVTLVEIANMLAADQLAVIDV